MPRLPIDYSKTIIYKICCNDVSIKEIYVGHTTDLVRRTHRHKQSCNNEKSKKYNYNIYQFIRANGGWDNWSLVPVEEYPCENVNQACIRERYWIETLQASLNVKVPSRSKKEYSKEYRENNEDKLNEKRKEWYKNNVNYYKEYRENNEDKINEKRKEKFICECGGYYIYINKIQHFKTKKHQEYLSAVYKDRQERTP